MRKDKTYRLLVEKMHEVAAVPPQSVGPFTFIYKRMVPFLKFYPWRSTLILAFLTSFFLYLLFGVRLIKLASLLQFGF